jgi:hypothetical protein
MGSGGLRSRWLDGSTFDFGTTTGREVRYTLAGQLDTPGGARAGTPGGLDGVLDESVYSDVDYRRALGPRQDSSARFAEPSGVGGSPGWGLFALGAIGGVVGKFWEFCKTGAFKGFHAGGGRGYEFQAGQASPLDPHPGSTDRPRLPGGFPSADAMSSYPDPMETSAEPTPSRPAAKRRQVSEANDDLRRNWVMVENPNGEKRPALGGRRTSSRLSGPAGRKAHVPALRLNGSTGPAGLARRSSHRVSHAAAPALTTREPASYASPRSPRPHSPLLTTQRAQSPSRIPVPSPRAAAAPSSSMRTRKSQIPSPMQAGFGANSHRRTHSGASAASTRSRPRDRLDVDDIEASPRLDAEAKKLATRRMIEEEDTDARISAFNARLRDMIRQGKEALSTKVEVTMEEGGWSDEE